MAALVAAVTVVVPAVDVYALGVMLGKEDRMSRTWKVALVALVLLAGTAYLILSPACWPNSPGSDAYSCGGKLYYIYHYVLGM